MLSSIPWSCDRAGRRAPHRRRTGAARRAAARRRRAAAAAAAAGLLWTLRTCRPRRGAAQPGGVDCTVGWAAVRARLRLRRRAVVCVRGHAVVCVRGHAHIPPSATRPPLAHSTMKEREVVTVRGSDRGTVPTRVGRCRIIRVRIIPMGLFRASSLRGCAVTAPPCRRRCRGVRAAKKSGRTRWKCCNSESEGGGDGGGGRSCRLM